MVKYFVTKGQIGFDVIYENFDKVAGNHYVAEKLEFKTELEAQSYADTLNGK